jgi:hypothetical protein
MTRERKETGALGERIAAEYLRRRGFTIVDHNVSRKTGEIDVIAQEGDTLHFVEVKTIECDQFPDDTKPSVSDFAQDEGWNDPSLNLHEAKIRKVARTGEWYVMQKNWEGDWQIDGALVWLRRSDGKAKVRFLPQIV